MPQMIERQESDKACTTAAVTELGFSRSETIRLIEQALQSLGLSESVKMVEQESGVFLNESSVDEFIHNVFMGNWNLVEEFYESINYHQLFSPKDVDKACVKFLIKECQFIELLLNRDIVAALTILRNELTPICDAYADKLMERDNLSCKILSRDRLHNLSSMLLCRSSDDVSANLGLSGKLAVTDTVSCLRSQLISTLQPLMLPGVLIPENRLEHLLRQAVSSQISKCIYHNIHDQQMSLFEDHHCSLTSVPNTCGFILEGHKNEVWYIAFSHCGRYLASASKDCTAIIWDLLPTGVCPVASSDIKNNQQNFIRHILEGHTESISYLSWSPDDTKLLTCANDKIVMLWMIVSGQCIRTYDCHSGWISAAAWLPDGFRFITSGHDKRVCMCDIDGNVLQKWQNDYVLHDIVIDKDGFKLTGICSDRAVRIMDLDNHNDVLLRETEAITSLSVSANGDYILLNMASQEIRLWDVVERRLLRKYRGQKQGRYVIRSCFGGVNDNFIASGSEDCNVYLWHRETASLVNVLSGHTGTVNTVAWSPTNPQVLASASDDFSIRMWTV